MGNRLRDIRERLGLTQAAVAEKLDISVPTVSRHEAGRTVTHAQLERYAAIYGCGVGEILAGGAPAPDANPIPAAASGDVRLAGLAVPSFAAMPLDVPVRGIAAGTLGRGAFQLSDDPIGYVRRPPGLVGAVAAYAIYVTGVSMVPAHPPGALRYVHPLRPTKAGDDVIVQVQLKDSEPIQSYLKRQRRTDDQWLTVEQHNPRATIKFSQAHVVAVHLVLTLNDLMGA